MVRVIHMATEFHNNGHMIVRFFPGNQAELNSYLDFGKTVELAGLQ